MQTIIHIIGNTTFTDGYISFMNTYMNKWKHKFIIPRQGFAVMEENCEDVILTDSANEILKNETIKKELRNCRSIIVSGLFGGLDKILFVLPSTILRKTYIQFWGGDFYWMRDIATIKGKLHKELDKVLFRRAGGVILLLEGEYKELLRLTGLKKLNYFVAPVTDAKSKRRDYKNLRQTATNGNRIIVGNSATETNKHIEAFQMLQHLVGDGIEVYCPLSYGDEAYRQYVIEQGNLLLGKSFHPLLEFMDLESYIEFLATCDVGIFNNNRQQALGNIFNMFLLGKKVYLRENTSMWRTFKQEGYRLYDVKSLETIGKSDLLYYSKEESARNIQLTEKRLSVEADVKAWEKVFSEGESDASKYLFDGL